MEGLVNYISDDEQDYHQTKVGARNSGGSIKRRRERSRSVHCISDSDGEAGESSAYRNKKSSADRYKAGSSNKMSNEDKYKTDKYHRSDDMHKDHKGSKYDDYKVRKKDKRSSDDHHRASSSSYDNRDNSDRKYDNKKSDDYKRYNRDRDHYKTDRHHGKEDKYNTPSRYDDNRQNRGEFSKGRHQNDRQLDRKYDRRSNDDRRSNNNNNNNNSESRKERQYDDRREISDRDEKRNSDRSHRQRTSSPSQRNNSSRSDRSRNDNQTKRDSKRSSRTRSRSSSIDRTHKRKDVKIESSAEISRSSISPPVQQERQQQQQQQQQSERKSLPTARNFEGLLNLPPPQAIINKETLAVPPPPVAAVVSTVTGSPTVVQLPSYYNPNVINPTKYAEQIQKRKLIWGAKKTEDAASKWGHAQFSQDSDGKVANKFMRLMGIKNAAAEAAAAAPKETEQQTTTAAAHTRAPDVKSREAMFSTMEHQYEVARQVTHTMRGVGLGFGSAKPY